MSTDFDHWPDAALSPIELAALPDICTLFERMRSIAATSGSDCFPGYITTYDPVTGRATAIDEKGTVSQGAALAVFTEGGVRCVELIGSRPSLETEGFGKVVRTTSKYPLVTGGEITSETVLGWPGEDGRLVAPQVIDRKTRLLDDPTCANLATSLRSVMGNARATPRQRESVGGAGSRVRLALGWLTRRSEIAN